ncbi:GNAT family N-acetyltransferase [Paenibacillus mesotrionivorans]|uniref:GNAT family N-acetyltransferase n=1 Tax=Paenibacillus mesotrionivorans TaxID=3160968 RepID=A0ACC7NZE5_9BACL
MNDISAKIVIRSAVGGDADTLRSIFRCASLTYEGARELFAAHPEWLEWDDSMLPFARVAVVDGRVVGFASARPVDDFLELEDLFTDPHWMRKGVATALIEDAASRGLRIEVTASPQAAGFYESVGFITNGVTHTQGGPAPRMQLDVT